MCRTCEQCITRNETKKQTLLRLGWNIEFVSSANIVHTRRTDNSSINSISAVVLFVPYKCAVLDGRGTRRTNTFAQQFQLLKLGDELV